MNIVKGIEILKENGIAAEKSTAIKNGKEVVCVQLGEGKIRPSIYEGFFESCDTEAELLERVHLAMESTPEVNIEEFFNRDFFLQNCISCIRYQTTDAKSVTFKVFGDLEEYIRVRLNLEMSVVVTHAHLEMLSIDAEELRALARQHLAEEAIIRPMSEVMASITGMPEDTFDMPSGVWVASNRTACHGAAVILLEDMLREFCIENAIAKLCIIPSSIHEAIFTIAEVDEEIVDSTINEVNASSVEKSEQLSTHCYFFEVINSS